MKKLLVFVLVLAAGIVFSFSEQPRATEVSADVVFIHGFQGGRLVGNDWDNEASMLTAAKEYFAHWDQYLSKKVRVGYVPWDSKNTIVRNTANPADTRPGWMKAADRMLKLIDEEGYGANGIIVITHSTGGLLGDVMMSQCYLAQYNSDPNIKKYYKIWQKTTAMVQVASASGGVELAAIASDIVYGTASWPLIGDLIKKVFPYLKAGDPSTFGVMYDLQPSVARSENSASLIRMPAFMIAGSGTMYLNIGKPFLKGTSDGCVAMHSGCGSNKWDAYESCSGSLAPDGQLTSQNAPTTYAFHYPYLMTTEGHLSEMTPGDGNTDLDWASKTETLISNYGSWSNVASESSTTGWWIWKKYFSNVKDSDTRSLGEIVSSHFRLIY